MAKTKKAATLSRDRAAALREFIAANAGEVMLVGAKMADTDVKMFPTGVTAVDAYLSRGGLPVGRHVEVFGPESSGKTTFALTCVAEAHRRGKTCLYVDAEHSLDLTYAKTLGVDLQRLLLVQPMSAEAALDTVIKAVDAKVISLVVIDSVAAMTPQAELEGEMADSHMGLHARLMSKAMRKMTSVMASSDVTVLWINQIRNKIGVVFGSPEVTTGGSALKFYASLRLDMRPGKGFRAPGAAADTPFIGRATRIKCVKNKTGVPYRRAEVPLVFGQGYDNLAWVFGAAVELGVVTKSGAWYAFDGAKLGQGVLKALIKVREDGALESAITAATLRALEGE